MSNASPESSDHLAAPNRQAQGEERTSRRDALKVLGVTTATGTSAVVGRSASVANEVTKNPDDGAGAKATGHRSAWHRCFDRVFLGGDYWANPMEDWRIKNGAAECMTTGGNRNIQLLTGQLVHDDKSFEMSVTIKHVEDGGAAKGEDGGAGFRIGIRSEINEYRSNCFTANGLIVGVRGGKLVIGKKTTPLMGVDRPDDLTVRLVGNADGARTHLQVVATLPSGKTVGELDHHVATDSLLGNVALVNNFNPKLKKGQGSRYRFSHWNVEGDAFDWNSNRAFGPILWSMYSLSDSRSDEGFVLKISALTGPMGTETGSKVELQIRNDEDGWQSLGTAKLDTDAWTATFRVPHWNEKESIAYRLVYREGRRDGESVENSWSGIIRANPAGRPLRMAALTCQNDYGFPYQPVVENVVRLDPDLVYFSGDQLYEGHGGFGLIREPAEPAILNYLRKFYQFGISFRDAMKDRPTICLADDHDVFQGNIWGEGGKPMDIEAGGTSSNGGYREPARMVNAVHRTNTSHHPDFYDDTPVLQDISVYYGDMVYGGVSFAILADRQWKSGPQHVDTGSGRADHLKDRNIDPRTLDKPGLVLLGERQEKFLEAWAQDWRGHTLKVVLSQTVLAGVATHHGGYDGYLVADLDSGGWPQTARDRTVEIIKKAKPLHINGDQHLTTLVQYGVDKQRDGCWSFCTPAIAAGYPRWWRPDEMEMPHTNRPKHGLPNTGEYVDGLGNKAYVYAVGNPEVGKSKNRYEKAHEKGSGFGLITMDTVAKTYHVESFRFLIDATDGRPENQFPGWPVTIHQDENDGQIHRLG